MPFSPFNQRVQRQFSGLFNPGGLSLQDYQQPVDDSGRYYSDIRDLYSRTPALDAYRAHLQNAPNPEDYKPSIWDRIASGLSGFSAGMKDAGEGIRVAQALNRSRYDRALEEFYNQAQPLHQMASLERQGIDDQIGHIMKANELGLKYDDYRRQLAKDQTDAALKSREIAVDEGALDWRKQYEGKRLNQFDRDINSLADYRRSLGSAAGMNAQTNRMNAQTNRANVDSLSDYRENQSRLGWGQLMNDQQRIGQSKIPTAANLSTAEQDELYAMQQIYPDFITTTPDNRLVVKAPPSVGTPEYQDYLNFIQELQARINHRVRTGQISFGLGPSDFGGGGPWDLVGTEPE